MADWKQRAFWVRVLIIFLPIAALISAGAYLLCRAEETRLHEELAAEMRDSLLIGRAAIDNTLQTSVKDLNYLSQQPILKSAIAAPIADNLASLSQYWVIFSNARQIYDRIRWIDEAGMERVQVDYAGSQASIAPPEALQNRSNRYFFLDAIGLNRNEVYISPLDLYIEGEAIQDPFAPTIRFGTPLFDSSGVKSGILVLNYQANDLLNRLQDRAKMRGVSAWLVNQDGYWLRGPDPKEDFGFMFSRNDLTLAARHPGAWEKISSQEEGQFETSDGLWSFNTVHPLRQEQRSSTGSSEIFGPSQAQVSGRNYYWKTVSLLPTSEYNAGLTTYRSRIAGSALLLMILFFAGAWVLVRLQYAERRARLGLEKAVDERTQELRISNDKLSLEQIRQRRLIETLPELIWLKDPAGVYILCNRQFERFFGAKEKDIVGKTDYDFVGKELADFFGKNDITAVEADCTLVNEEWITYAEDGRRALLETTKVPVKAASGELIGVLGIAHDITARRAAEECERQLKNMYRTLSQTNEAILHQLDETALFRKICQIAVDHGKMLLAWIGIADKSSQRIIAAAVCENAFDYAENLVASIDPDLPEGKGPLGIAYRENRPVIIDDYETDERMAPWREGARRYGIQSSATFPILRSGKPYAVFIVHYDRKQAFDDQSVSLLKRMARNIGFALDNIDREWRRRQAEEALKASESRLKQFYDAGLIGVIFWDMDGCIKDANEKFLEMVGYDREELEAGMLRWVEMISPESLPTSERAIAEIKSSRANRQPYEKVYLCKNGQPIAVEIASAMLDDENGVAFVLDITERKKAEEGMRLAEMVYKDSSEAMIVTDENNKMISVNPAFERITGYKKEEVIGKETNFLKSGRQGAEFYQDMWQSILDTGRWKGEVWNRTKAGEEYAASLTINTIYGSDRTVHRRVAFLSDITIKKGAEEKVWYQANFDILTGLPNRNLFREHLRQAIRHANRTKLPMALLFIDLDGFKHVNDTLGHDMGDLLLKEVAERLKGCVRDIDTVARLGGDEFTVVLSELRDPGRVDRIARHILQRLSAPIKLNAELVHISGSVGITLYPQDTAELEGMLKNADQAMYAAKQEGKNRYHFFTPEMQQAAMARMHLINDLRGALDEGQIEVVYQPIVEMATGCIAKAEALMRWQHPTKGLINPTDFISTAEETGLIGPLGNWMVEEAVRQAAKWREQFHPEFQISVNVSPVQFRNGNLSFGVWIDHLKRMGLPGNAIVIEITEGLLLEASEQVKGLLLDLRDAGIEVALDDFGTGYSALSYLKKFDIDYLKIDQSFVRNLSSDSTDLALCEAIIQMAHRLDIKVIAEGVETEGQRDLLEKAGCDFVQGYLYSPPLPAGKLDKFLHLGSSMNAKSGSAAEKGGANPAS
jgi:diguanylate cyclase (GGDEF)-like protein/PAS domain S-box-containing protein